jgi:hypothetical protein
VYRAPLTAILAIVLSLLTGWVPVPAQDGTPAATPAAAAATIEVLLDTTITGMPVGRTRIGVDRWRLRPSPRLLTMPALGGPVTVAVESGAITAIEAGTELRIAGGEYHTFFGSDPLTFAAEGPEEAIASVVYVVPGFFSETGWDSDPLAHSLDYPIDGVADDLAGGAGHVLLERITLPPGNALPPQEVSPLVWWGLAAGRVGMTLEGPRLPFRWDAGEERTFAGGETLPFLAPGTQMTLRNAEDRPVVLYRLTLSPEIAAGTPAP